VLPRYSKSLVFNLFIVYSTMTQRARITCIIEPISLFFFLRKAIKFTLFTQTVMIASKYKANHYACLSPEISKIMSKSGSWINNHLFTYTPYFNLQIPKVECFMPLPCRTRVPICIKIDLFVFVISCSQVWYGQMKRQINRQVGGWANIRMDNPRT